MYLRAYKHDDLPAIFALDRVCFQPPFRFSRGAMRQFAEAPNALVQLACEHTAEGEPEQLCGFAIVHLEDTGQGSDGYVVTLDVTPAYRRQGIAEALMRSAERMCLRLGAHAVTLHVFRENIGAVRLYERLGYLYEQRVANFYGRGLDAAIYRKPLRPDEGSLSKVEAATGEGE